MSFSIGIVGLPNVGKSTLFKALTKKQVDTSNYPFCTIDPNVGVVEVPDIRLQALAQVLKPEKVLPTTIEFVDVAGLVKGAHQGEGLGNQFLSHIREVEALAHLVRQFPDENVIHVAGEINPLSDIETINLELIMADFNVVKKRLEDVSGKARSGDKEAKEMLQVLEKIKAKLGNGEPASRVRLSREELVLVKELNLLTWKPLLIIVNISEKEISQGPLIIEQLKELVTEDKELKNNIVAISAKIESELAELPNEEQQEYKKELGLEKSGLDEVIATSYKLLGLVTFFTCQNNILQAWTVPRSTKAAQAAGKIHTDFEKGFIRAEVVNWEDLTRAGSELKAKEKGMMRVEGKEYVVQDGDVVHFKV